ncbi:hypothetical protein CK203_096082 [Vitis vinifera]|uniref:NB-ARC domain-containing protein n=1 Tax=Vitis vinifera TaxID=29760 RepID=A0A438CN44_VITVI|nr:hypothetical protein CK203_096082 [Vitis vinifera]
MYSGLETPKNLKGIAKIQQQIADMLGLEFKRKDESTRALELKTRLKEVKTLIILNDIWEEVGLKESEFLVKMIRQNEK